MWLNEQTLLPELSSGIVEGNVDRIKRIKRDGYGCAGFDLLCRQIRLSN
ncbi:hypothetical protein [Cryptosporangium phraense]|nr:hypothetical protein [Cryptosporangium phraense]